METSGFFNAEQLIDGTYDRRYIALQFANYFKSFVGNGVFINPTNQLKVFAVEGQLKIKINPGRMFANGYWYDLSEEMLVEIDPNLSAGDRSYSVQIRFDDQNRIAFLTIENYIEPNRVSPYYELQLAHFYLPPGASEITDSMIIDDRPNENVCGFVKGLVEVLATNDLFTQFESIFTIWFEDLKGKLTGDPATVLQAQIDRLTMILPLELTTDGWTEVSGVFTKTIPVLDVLETDDLTIDRNLTEDMTAEQVKQYEDKFSKLMPCQGVTSDGAITLILYNELTEPVSIVLRGG